MKNGVIAILILVFTCFAGTLASMCYSSFDVASALLGMAVLAINFIFYIVLTDD